MSSLYITAAEAAAITSDSNTFPGAAQFFSEIAIAAMNGHAHCDFPYFFFREGVDYTTSEELMALATDVMLANQDKKEELEKRGYAVTTKLIPSDGGMGGWAVVSWEHLLPSTP